MSSMRRDMTRIGLRAGTNRVLRRQALTFIAVAIVAATIIWAFVGGAPSGHGPSDSGGLAEFQSSRRRLLEDAEDESALLQSRLVRGDVAAPPSTETAAERPRDGIAEPAEALASADEYRARHEVPAGLHDLLVGRLFAAGFELRADLRMTEADWKEVYEQASEHNVRDTGLQLQRFQAITNAAARGFEVPMDAPDPGSTTASASQLASALDSPGGTPHHFFRAGNAVIIPHGRDSALDALTDGMRAENRRFANSAMKIIERYR